MALVPPEYGPSLGIKEAVEGFSTTECRMGIYALMGLGEGIEEGPRCPGLERLMTRFTPFMQHHGHLSGGDHPGIQGPDYDVVCTGIADLYLLVPLDPLIQLNQSVA